MGKANLGKYRGRDRTAPARVRRMSAKGQEVGRPGRYQRRQAKRAGMLPPSERSGQKAAPAARRGGHALGLASLAARADLPTQQEPPRIASADPIRNSLYPSLKVRASRARRAASEHACQAQGIAAAPDLAAGKKWSSQRVSNRGNLPPRLCVEFVGPWKNWAEKKPNLKWSGRRDLNSGPFAPQANALPGCATPRPKEF